MDLMGSMLIAMPGMADPRFEHAVVLVCAHSPQGAMGLIVNKPVPPGIGWAGFVLHSPDWPKGRAVQTVAPGIVLTSTRDILEDIAAGRGPVRALLALGYAGWGPGQLEAEIGANGWLTGAADAELVLGAANARKWETALRGLGVDPLSLSAAAGRA